MRIMAVDIGRARTGVAISDERAMLASPVGVINESYDPYIIEKLCEHARNLGAQRIVVGLPLNMDGSEGESARHAREFADALGEKSGLPIVMFDERCTTVSAHNILSANNVRGKKRKNVVDTVAAVVILQAYLDSPQSKI